MKKIVFSIFTILFINVVNAKTLVLECSQITSGFSPKSEVIINTNTGFISMHGWIVKDEFAYSEESGEIEAWGIIKEHGKDSDFRHIKYLEKEKILAWSDSFFRPRGVFGDNPPHKYVSSGNFQILKCQ